MPSARLSHSPGPGSCRLSPGFRLSPAPTAPRSTPLPGAAAPHLIPHKARNLCRQKQPSGICRPSPARSPTCGPVGPLHPWVMVPTVLGPRARSRDHCGQREPGPPCPLQRGAAQGSRAHPCPPREGIQTPATSPSRLQPWDALGSPQTWRGRSREVRIWFSPKPACLITHVQFSDVLFTLCHKRCQFSANPMGDPPGTSRPRGV